ncbi:MAG TPA: shikimate kinase [Candidatus Bathyarchaeota archaeon]|nr:shikimate kinase [Candidatus Bathyarchaeota archaeon]
MTLTGRAVAYGAITVINAISCGLGAALGVELRTEAYVELTDTPGRIEGKILSDPEESTILIEKAVSKVLEYFGLQDEYGAYVETRSNIPIARGLKSSSVAANAIVLAVLDALGEKIDDMAILNLGVDAAIDAGVTITGAFDDASASYFGGLTITDNRRREILKHIRDIKQYPVLIHVPEGKIYTSRSNVRRMRIIADEVRALHRMALRGDYWQSMTLNGIIYSEILGFDAGMAIDALENGALAAGLSGTGPSIAAIVPEEKIDDVRETWSKREGRLIETRINLKKAHILE